MPFINGRWVSDDEAEKLKKEGKTWKPYSQRDSKTESKKTSTSTWKPYSQREQQEQKRRVELKPYNHSFWTPPEVENKIMKQIEDRKFEEQLKREGFQNVGRSFWVPGTEQSTAPPSHSREEMERIHEQARAKDKANKRSALLRDALGTIKNAFTQAGDTIDASTDPRIPTHEQRRMTGQEIEPLPEDGLMGALGKAARSAQAFTKGGLDAATFGISKELDKAVRDARTRGMSKEEKEVFRRNNVSLDEPQNKAEEIAADLGGIAGTFIGGGAVAKGVAKTAAGKSVKNTLEDLADRGFSKRKSPLPNIPGTRTPTQLSRGERLGKELSKAALAAGAFSTARGMLEGYADPNIDERNFSQTFGANFRAGIWNNVHSIGSAMKWADYNEAGQKLQDYAAQQSKGFQTDYSKEFTFTSLLDPEFYATSFAQSAPSIFATLPLSVIGGMGGAAVGGALGLGAFGRTMLAAIGGTALSVPAESAMIAGGVYEEALKRGFEEQEATEKAQNVFYKTIAVTAILQVPELLAIFAPARKFAPLIQRELGPGGDLAVRVAAAGTLEGTQEVAQEWVVKSEFGDDFSIFDPDVQQSFALGALLGGGMTLGTSLTDFGESVAGSGPHEDPFKKVVQRTKEKLPDDLKTQHQQSVDQNVSNGMDPEKAELEALEEIARTEEGKEIVTEATLEVVDTSVKEELRQAETSTDAEVNAINKLNTDPTSTEGKVVPDKPAGPTNITMDRVAGPTNITLDQPAGPQQAPETFLPQQEGLSSPQTQTDVTEQPTQPLVTDSNIPTTSDIPTVSDTDSNVASINDIASDSTTDTDTDNRNIKNIYNNMKDNFLRKRNGASEQDKINMLLEMKVFAEQNGLEFSGQYKNQLNALQRKHMKEGTKVTVDRFPGEFTVVDTSDKSQFTVKNAQGTELKVARQKVTVISDETTTPEQPETEDVAASDEWKAIKHDISSLGRLKNPRNRVKHLEEAIKFAETHGLEYPKERWNELIDKFTKEAETQEQQQKDEIEKKKREEQEAEDRRLEEIEKQRSEREDIAPEDMHIHERLMEVERYQELEAKEQKSLVERIKSRSKDRVDIVVTIEDESPFWDTFIAFDDKTSEESKKRLIKTYPRHYNEGNFDAILLTHEFINPEGTSTEVQPEGTFERPTEQPTQSENARNQNQPEPTKPTKTTQEISNQSGGINDFVKSLNNPDNVNVGDWVVRYGDNLVQTVTSVNPVTSDDLVFGEEFYGEVATFTHLKEQSQLPKNLVNAPQHIKFAILSEHILKQANIKTQVDELITQGKKTEANKLIKESTPGIGGRVGEFFYFVAPVGNNMERLHYGTRNEQGITKDTAHMPMNDIRKLYEDTKEQLPEMKGQVETAKEPEKVIVTELTQDGTEVPQGEGELFLLNFTDSDAFSDVLKKIGKAKGLKNKFRVKYTDNQIFVLKDEDSTKFVDEIVKEFNPSSSQETEATTEETPAVPKTPFNEGDRVIYTLNGKKFTGRIRSISLDNTATIEVDQSGSAGGVPIGRLDIVNLDILRPEETETAAPEATTEETETAAPEATAPEPEEAPAEEPTTAPEIKTNVEDVMAEAINNNIILGRTVTAVTPRNTEVDVTYGVVEVDDLITSNTDTGSVNPDYPQQFQPRQRTRAQSQQQIDRIANQLNPALLGENPLTTDGAPIIGSDLVVESGNGRTIAIRQVYNKEQLRTKRSEYLNWLTENANTFGLNRDNIELMQNPILVRVRVSDVNRAEFALESNEASISRMSATEQAMADANAMSGTLMNLFVPNDKGEINTADNRDFIRGFMDSVASPNERNALIDNHGYLSQDGMNRVRNAIFARAYGDARAVSTLAESTDTNVKTILNQLIMAAPRAAFVEDMISDNVRYDVGISQNITEALNKISELRREGTKVETFLNQMSMFEEMPDISKELLRFFDEYGSSKKGKPARLIGSTIIEYYRLVDETGDPNQISLFGDEPTPTREQLLDVAIRKVIDNENLQTSLFEGEEGPNLFDTEPDSRPDEQSDSRGSQAETQAEPEEVAAPAFKNQTEAINFFANELVQDANFQNYVSKNPTQTLNQIYSVLENRINDIIMDTIEPQLNTMDSFMIEELLKENSKKKVLKLAIDRFNKQQPTEPEEVTEAPTERAALIDLFANQLMEDATFKSIIDKSPTQKFEDTYKTFSSDIAQIIATHMLKNKVRDSFLVEDFTSEDTKKSILQVAINRHNERTPAKEPTKFDAARERLKRLDNLAKRADEYLKANKNRINALPLDLFAAAAIVGANKIAHGVVDLAEWSEQMMAEYGKELRLSIKALYTQSNEILTFSDEDLDEYLSSVGLEQLEQGEETDGTQSTRNDGRGTLEEVPTEDVPRTEADRTITETTTSSTGPDRGSVVPDVGGIDTEAPTEREDERGTESGSLADTTQPSVGDGTRDVDSSSQRTGQRRTVKPSAGERTERKDFQITNELSELGGAKTRYKNNVEAIRTLVKVETEKRLATAEEQQILARYVGWGGLSQAFDQKNKTWSKEYQELKSLVEENIISQADYEAARKSTTTSFYTSPEVVDFMYKALNRLGYENGGRVLEPSMGTGNFFGLMPKPMMKNTSRTGVELDNLTARIAKQLYQKANVKNIGFEKFVVDDGHFDIAIGNVPFGSIKIVDSSYTGKLNFVKSRIHNYFFIKSLDKVRDGGIVAFITSSGTLNSRTNKDIRELIGTKADFLGAVRLPGDAFKQSAATEVTSDIIFLQKRANGQQPNHVGNFFETKEITVTDQNGNPATVMQNEYFVNNPEMELGTHTVDKLTGKRLGLQSDGRNINEALNEVLNNLPENIYTSRKVEVEPEPIVDKVYFDTNELAEGSIGLQDGDLVQKVNGEVVKYTPKTKSDENRIKGMIPIRLAAQEVLTLQKEGATDQELKAAQDKLNNVYDTYVKKNGFLNEQANRRAIADDVLSASLLSSIEKVTETGKGKSKKITYTKDAIFSERTINAARKVTSVDTSEEALVVSLFENGTVDLDMMARLTNKPKDELVSELKGRIFKDPLTETWEIADIYLSGNVRQKYREALAAGPDYKENADALKAVIPEDLTPNQINVRLGAPWIPTTDVSSFINEILDVQDKVKVEYVGLTSRWYVSEKNPGRNPLYFNARNTDEFGVKNNRGDGATALKLIEDALNLKQTNITYYDRDLDKNVIDLELTNEARQKQQQLQDIFKDWLWEDSARSERLLDYYNENFNNTRLPDYDGSMIYGGQDETNRPLPGMSEKYLLRPHQKDAIWRIVQGYNTLLAHVVGAGKTLEMIAGGMEMKRLGFISKPMYVVPNHLLDQWEREFRDAYPAANILKIGNDDIPSVSVQRSQIAEDFKNKSQLVANTKVTIKGDRKRYTVVSGRVEKGEFLVKDTKGKESKKKVSEVTKIYRDMTDQEYEERRKVRQAERGAALNKIAVGNYDAIIITHQTFQKLPVSPETVQTHIREQLQDVEIALTSLLQEGETKGSRSVKQLETAKANLEAAILEDLTEERKNVAIPFEELGVDQIFVDESHMFKNLKFHTKMQNVAGIPQTKSQRAQDMFLKTKWLSDTRGGKGVVFASGTPISNTMAELYTLQRYLQMHKLRDLNLGHFDAWAAIFGEAVTGIELDTTGKFIQKTRFARFHNVAELMTLYKTFADIKTADMLDLPRPENVNYETVVSPMSEFQEEYIRQIRNRAEAIKNGQVQPNEDNFLKLTGDGRKMALDVRMVTPEAPDFEESKVNKAVDNIVKIFKDKNIGKDRDGNVVENTTQLVFLDMGTPKKKKETDDDVEGTDVEQDDVSVYEDIRNKLIAKGIPRNKIAFIHEANTDARKKELFKQMNDGEMRILIGSTEKMGAGMNVQQRLVALHHLDAPWRPSDVEQREGRIIRQGNKNNEVHIYSYTTEGTFDANMWDTIRRKATFINQVMNGSAEVRSMEDVEASVMGYSEIVAVTSGNPLILEQVELQKQVSDLSMAKTAHERSIRQAKKEIRELPGEIDFLKKKEAAHRQDLKTRKDTSGDKFTFVLDGVTYTKRKEAGEALIAYIEKPALTNDLQDGDTKEVGQYAGFPLFYTKGKALPFTLKGVENYNFIPNAESALGSVQKMDAAISNIEKMADGAKAVYEQHEKNLETFKKNAEKPFTKQAELDEANERLNDVQRRIMEEDGDNQTADTELEETEAYRGTAGIDTFVEPLEREATGTGEDRRQWRGKLFGEQDEADEHRTINRARIIRFLSESFHVPIGTGKFKGRTEAIYKKQANIIRTKNYADFVALSHELGHRLDEQFNFTTKPDVPLEQQEIIFKELHDLAVKNLNSQVINEATPLAITRREGFAEFVRLYFDNPQQIFEELPETTEYFGQVMKNAKWDKSRLSPADKKEFKDYKTLLDALDIAADMLDIWREQKPQDRIDGVISSKEDRTFHWRNLFNSRYMKDKATTAMHSLYDSVFEELQPIERALTELTGQRLKNRKLAGQDDPFIRAWNSRGIAGKIKTFIDFGVVDNDGNKVGPALREILEMVPDLTEFKRYLVARHAKDLIKNHGKTKTPIAIRDADKIIRDASDEIKEAADLIYEYQEAVTNELVRSGLLDTKQVDSWKLSYPYYVPFYRVMEDKGRTGEQAAGTSPGKRFANQQNPIKRMKEKGSSRDIIDPIESIIKNTYMYLQIAERNDVGRSLADVVDQTPDSAWLMEKIDTPQFAQKFSLNEIQSSLERANLDLDNANLDEVAMLFRPVFMSKASDQELTVYRNGNPEFYKVNDKTLFSALLALERDTMNWITKLLAAPNQLLRQTITATPDFIGRQAWRALGTTTLQTQSFKRLFGLEAAKIIPMTAINLGRLIFTKKQSQKYFEWLSGGGAASTLQELDRDYMGETSKSLLKLQNKTQKIYAAKNLINPLSWLRAMNLAGQTLDEAFRMTEYQQALRETGDRAKAIQRSRDVDYDPSRFGSKTRGLNRVLLFLNPALQGPEKFVRTIVNQPATTLVRGTVFLTLPTLALMAMNWEDEEYWELPSWRRDMFWNIPLGNGSFFSIPIPFEWGLIFKTLPERLLANFAKEHPEIVEPNKDWLGNVKTSITPEFVPTIISPIIEWKLNRSLAFNSPIVPMGMEKLEPSEQFNANTSELAKLTGKELNISPMKLDAFYEGYTGTAGQLPRVAMDKFLLWSGLSVSDVPLPDEQKNLLERTFTGFVTNVDKGSTTSINVFYDRLNKLEKEQKSLNKPGYIPPELKAFRSVSKDMADMRAMRNWIVLENRDLTPEQKKQWITDIDRTLTDYARLALGKELRYPESSAKVFAATEWFQNAKEQVESQNRKEAKRDFNYK